MIVKLPSELIHHILADLADDAAALRSSALTCKLLAIPSQMLLFRRVELHLHTSVVTMSASGRKTAPNNDLTKEAKLFNALSANPYLATFVHDVTLYDLFGGQELIFMDPELDGDVIQNLFGMSEEALLVLGLLTHAKRLTVCAHNARSWMHLHPKVEEAVRKAMASPHLTSIEVDAMAEFPIALFDSCSTTLKHVSISTFPSLQLSFEPAAARVGENAPIFLESLFVSTSTSNLGQLVEWMEGSKLDISRLSRLVVRALGDEHKGVQALVSRLVAECSSTLEELEFFAYLPCMFCDLSMCTYADRTVDGRTVTRDSDVLAVCDTINLGQLPSLTKVSIRYWLSDLSDSTHQLPLLARLLRSMDLSPRLTELTLHFVIIHSRSPTDPCKGAMAWAVLDDVIEECRPQMLRSVVVQMESIPEGLHQATKVILRNGLRKVVERFGERMQIVLSSSPRFIPFFR